MTDDEAIDAWVERQLATAPPITDNQITRLRMLMWGPATNATLTNITSH